MKRVEERAAMSCDTVLKIFYQTCRGVQHMHKQKPTIIHRDLKVGGPTGGGPPRVGGWPGGAGLGGLAWGGWPGGGWPGGAGPGSPAPWSSRVTFTLSPSGYLGTPALLKASPEID